MEKYKDIKVQKFSTSTNKEHFLLSYKNSHYEVTAAVVALLLILQSNSSIDESIQEYRKLTNFQLSYEQVKELIQTSIEPIFALRESQSFLYQRILFTANQIEKYSNALRVLFFKPLFLSATIITLTLDAYFFTTTPSIFIFNNSINAYTIILLFIVTFLSSFIHELGHATACKVFGIKHGSIGFGMHYNIPVLYTDVSNIWKLKRSQRLVVNIAGIYFQMFLLTLILLLYFITGHYLIKYLILIINFGFIITLNPFFRFDGYWIISDLLAIPNLRERSREWIIYLYKKALGYANLTQPYIQRLNIRSRLFLALYTILINTFMGYYFFIAIPKFLIKLSETLPSEIEQFILYISNGINPPFALIRNISSQFVLVFLLGLFVYRTIKSIILNYANKKYEKEQ